MFQREKWEGDIDQGVDRTLDQDPGMRIQLSSFKRVKFILGFSEIFPINGTFYNGNIGENNHFILDLFGIFPFNCVPL